MKFYIKAAFVFVFLIININSSFSREIEIFPNVDKSEIEVRDFYFNYNNNNFDKLYEKLLSRSGEKPDKDVVLHNMEEKKKAIGRLVNRKLKLGKYASPNLLYLFYEATYENRIVMEFFCLTLDKSTKKPRITIDQVDTDNQMKNEGEIDNGVDKAELIVSEFRELYNQENYDSFYKKVDFGSRNYTVPKDKFLSMMNEQNKKLGKYISSQLLFVRNKNNGIVLTYLSQYEKYAVVEIWGVIRDSSSDKYRLRVYEVF